MPDTKGSANIAAGKDRPQGGDVAGTKKIDVTQGEACDVAAASFDPGYEFGNSLDSEDKASLLRGYCDYGLPIGEK